MSENLKKCPFCAEEINADAGQCPYCDEILNVSPSAVPSPAANPQPQSMQVSVVQQPKSNAPLILGIIATVLCVPSLLVAIGCASVCASVEGLFPAQEATTAALVVYIAAVLTCFICCFFGKSEKSSTSGALMILGGIVVIIASFLTGNIIFGLGGGICYLIGGVISCSNSKRQ